MNASALIDTCDRAESLPVASSASISARGRGPTTPPERVRTRYVPEPRPLRAVLGGRSATGGASGAGLGSPPEVFAGRTASLEARDGSGGGPTVGATKSPEEICGALLN